MLLPIHEPISHIKHGLTISNPNDYAKECIKNI